MAFGRLGASFGRAGLWAGSGGGVVGPPNLLTSSENVTSSNWEKNNITAASATRIVEQAVTASHQLTKLTVPVTAATAYCYWTEATAAECDRLMLYGLNLGGFGLGFDLTAGTTFTPAGIPAGGLLNSGILSLGGGRYRCWIALTAGSAEGAPALYMCSGTAFNYAGNASRGVTIHRQQLNVGTSPTAYRAT